MSLATAHAQKPSVPLATSVLWNLPQPCGPVKQPSAKSSLLQPSIQPAPFPVASPPSLPTVPGSLNAQAAAQYALLSLFCPSLGTALPGTLLPPTLRGALAHPQLPRLDAGAASPQAFQPGPAKASGPQLSGPPPVAAPPIVLLATPPPPRPITVVVPRMPEHVQPTTAPRGNVRWRRPVVYECKLCDVVAHSALDRDAHTASRDHVRRLLEREQRAVLVLGLPDGATVAEVRLIFEGFRLPPDAVQYISGLALGAEGGTGSVADGSVAGSSAASASGSSVGTEDDTEGPGCWHVLLNSVDDARRAAKTPPVTVGDHTVSIVLALQPHQCRLCRVTLNSAAQLQQHVKGSRHQGQLRQYAAHCTVVLTGVPPSATEADVRPLWAGCEEAEGGLTLQPDAEGLTQTVCVTFASLEDTDRALAQCRANPVVDGAPVIVARKREPPSHTAEPAPVTSGVKTSEEAVRLVCTLLRDHRIRDVEDLSLALFTRLTSTFLSCTPSPLTGVQPRDRFFADFDAQAGSKHGVVPLATALGLLRRLEHDWPAPLPACAQAWVQRRVTKYCPPGKLVKKAVFAQLRNTLCTAYQATEQVRTLLASLPPPAPRQPSAAPLQ